MGVHNTRVALIIIGFKSSADTYAKKVAIFYSNLLQALGFRVFIPLKAKRKSLLPKDSILIDDDNNASVYELLKNILEKFGLTIKKIEVSSESSLSKVSFPLVGILSGYGVSLSSLINLSLTLDSLGFYKKIFLTTDTLRENLARIDVLIIPGGDHTKIAAELGEENAKLIYDFVKSGGTLVGICAGSFLQLKPDSGEISPNDDTYILTRNMLGQIKAKVFNDSLKNNFIGWSYKVYRNNGIRTYPIMGPVSCNVKKTSSPFLVGLPKKFELWQEGPIVSVSDDSEVVVKGAVPKKSKRLGIKLKGNLKLSNFDLLVSKTIDLGKYVFVSAHLEDPRFPTGQILLANILWNSPKKVSEVDQNSSEKFFEFSPQVAHKKIENTRYLINSMLNLNKILTNMLPYVELNLPEYMFYEVLDLSSSLRRVSLILKKLIKIDQKIIIEEERHKKIMESIKRLDPFLKDSSDEFILSLIHKISNDRSRYMNYSERAISALTLLTSKLEKELSEVLLSFLKEISYLDYEKLKLAISTFYGGFCLMLPWYDGVPRVKRVSEQSFPGIFSPILSIYGEAKELLNTSKLVRNLSVA
ncbi:MAG: BPL-N domain-containing protein [Thermoproteota archaeon]